MKSIIKYYSSDLTIDHGAKQMLSTGQFDFTSIETKVKLAQAQNIPPALGLCCDP